VNIPTTIPYKLIAGAVASLVITATLLIQQADIRHWKKQSGQFEQLYQGEQIAHRLTVANYRAQAVKAAQADKDNVARVKTEQATINSERERSYEARIADARASYERLQPRAGTAPSHSSGSSVASVSPGTQHNPGAAGSTPQAELSDSDALIATEQAIQLDELEKAVIAQQAVSTSGPQ
jgi:hypothetical protein